MAIDRFSGGSRSKVGGGKHLPGHADKPPCCLPVRVECLICTGSCPRVVLSRRLLDTPLPSGMGRWRRGEAYGALPLTFTTCHKRARDARPPARCAGQTTFPGPASALRGIRDTFQSGGVARMPWQPRPLPGSSQGVTRGPARGVPDTVGV
jgi:hypothetical protein